MTPLVRILLRWLASFLIAKGIFAPDDTYILNDPELEQLVVWALGAAAGSAAEIWYWAAKKWGWAT